MVLEIDVNLLLIGFDKYTEDFGTIQDGIISELNVFKVQRFLNIHKNSIQEHAGSHVEYRIHYHVMEVNPAVQLYLHRFMEYAARDVDINLSSIRVINPYEIVGELRDLFRYVRKHSDHPVPSESDPILVLMNGQLGGKTRYGFSTEFSYTEEQKMIDEIFREGSEFAIGDFIFPLTEPLTLSEDYETTEEPVLHSFTNGSEESEDDAIAQYCLQDWNEVSLEWALEKKAALQALTKRGKRSSAEKTHHFLSLLRNAYSKKEQRRILVQMKQLLNNERMMNDELINMVEGTHVVSDFFFLQNVYFYDCTAGPFEWGSIDASSNIRTRTSLLDAAAFPRELAYYASLVDALLDRSRHVTHEVQRACAQPGRSDKRSECERDASAMDEVEKAIRSQAVKSTAEYARLFGALRAMEAKYRPARVAGHAQGLKDKAMEVTIRLSCVLSDVIAHAITPPMVLRAGAASADGVSTRGFSETVDGVNAVTSDSSDSSDSSAGMMTTPASYYFALKAQATMPSTRAELRQRLEEEVVAAPRAKERVHFQVNYLTRSGFEEFFSPDENFFDYSVFRSEVERLKLPTQEFFFSFQEYRLDKEPRLQTALLHALSSTIVPHLSTKRAIFPVQQSFLNTTTLFSLLRSSDGVLSGRDVQIYILCMTDPARRPVLLDHGEQVVVRSDAFNHIVFAVQNEKASSSSPYYFNNIPMHYNLHNIMSPLLSSVFELLSNTRLNLYIGEKVQTNESPLVEDFTQRQLGSVDAFFSANGVFSSYHRHIIQRGFYVVQVQRLIDSFNGLIVEVEKAREA